MSGTKLSYHRADIVQAAIVKFATKKLALEEMNGEFRIRSVRTPIEFGWDEERKVRTAYETNVRTFAGPFKSLAELAQALGVEKRGV